MGIASIGSHPEDELVEAFTSFDAKVLRWAQENGVDDCPRYDGTTGPLASLCTVFIPYSNGRSSSSQDDARS